MTNFCCIREGLHFVDGDTVGFVTGCGFDAIGDIAKVATPDVLDVPPAVSIR